MSDKTTRRTEENQGMTSMLARPNQIITSKRSSKLKGMHDILQKEENEMIINI